MLGRWTFRKNDGQKGLQEDGIAVIRDDWKSMPFADRQGRTRKCIT
jgi:hypothetical protein